ncbi:MAG: hypothetical protein R3F62_25725 [Planctomycetota bacterium]
MHERPAPGETLSLLTFLACLALGCLIVGAYADHRFGIDVFGPPRLPVQGLLEGGAVALFGAAATVVARCWGWRPPSALTSIGLIPVALIGVCGHRAGGLAGGLVGGAIGFMGFRAYVALEFAKHRHARELGRGLARVLIEPQSERALERRQRVRLRAPEPALASASARLPRAGDGRRPR